MKDNHPLLSYSGQFAALCDVLSPFNLQHITYQKIYKNGSKRLYLSNRSAWIMDYINLKLYNSSQFEMNPTQYQADCWLCLDEYDLTVYQHGKNYYNSDCSIITVNPLADSCEFFIFASQRQHAKDLIYLYYHREILYHFIAFFRDRGEKLLLEANAHKIAIASTDHLPMVLPHSEEATYHAKLTAFFDKTPLQGYKLRSYSSHDDESVHLNRRELECMKYFCQNLTAKQTARMVGLSYRSVEKYFEHLKQKLNCSTKQEIQQLLFNDQVLKNLLMS